MMRMSMRRATRLDDTFSKKIHNLELAATFHIMHYNFARTRKPLLMAPTRENGIASHGWSLDKIADLLG